MYPYYTMKLRECLKLQPILRHSLNINTYSDSLNLSTIVCLFTFTYITKGTIIDIKTKIGDKIKNWS